MSNLILFSHPRHATAHPRIISLTELKGLIMLNHANSTLPPRGVCSRILHFRRLFAATVPQSFHASNRYEEQFNLSVK